MNWILSNPFSFLGVILALLITIPVVSMGTVIFLVLPFRRRELRDRLRTAADDE